MQEIINLVGTLSWLTTVCVFFSIPTIVSNSRSKSYRRCCFHKLKIMFSAFMTTMMTMIMQFWLEFAFLKVYAHCLNWVIKLMMSNKFDDGIHKIYGRNLKLIFAREISIKTAENSLIFVSPSLFKYKWSKRLHFTQMIFPSRAIIIKIYSHLKSHKIHTSINLITHYNYCYWCKINSSS